MGRPSSDIAPFFIGLTVMGIISVIAPLTQAGLNPARDFGPRLVAYLAGWGSIALPGPRGGFFAVYILGPLLGRIDLGLAVQRGHQPADEGASDRLYLRRKTFESTIGYLVEPLLKTSNNPCFNFLSPRQHHLLPPLPRWVGVKGQISSAGGLKAG